MGLIGITETGTLYTANSKTRVTDYFDVKRQRFQKAKSSTQVMTFLSLPNAN